MTANFNELSLVIHETRKRAQLSREELSRLADVGATTIYDIEHGKETVQLQSLMKVCRALNITLTVTPPPLPGSPK